MATFQGTVDVYNLLLPNGFLDSHLLYYCFGIFIVYHILFAIYSITFHPLASIPGPKLAAISHLPYWLAAVQGRDVQWIYKLHLKYGPEVRYAPRALSYSSPKAWKEIYGREGGRDLEKWTQFYLQPFHGVPNMLTAMQKDHDRMRRLFAPAFSERALKAQEPLFHKYANILVENISRLGSDNTAIELTELYNLTTTDIMGELCFGHRLGLLERNDFSPWTRTRFESLQVLPFVLMINNYPLLHKIFKRFEPQSLDKQRQLHVEHTTKRVDQEAEQALRKTDLLSLAIEAHGKNPGHERGLSRAEMDSNVDIFMLAGSETTATLLSGLTYYLLTNPDKFDRLKQEIRNTFTSAGDLTFDSLAPLKYLNACVKETLRIYPPFPGGSPRYVPEEGKTILNRFIQGPARVSVHHYSTSHFPSNFSAPDHFLPERWLEPKDPQFENDILESVQPFSVGPRNCIGLNMALHEARLVFAKVMWAFEIELCEESLGWREGQRAIAVWLKKPLMCRIKAVERN